MPFLVDTNVFLRLVPKMAHSVQGVLIHDARTVSVMNVNGITHILTFDKDDFKRYTNITALSPLDV